MFYHYKIGDGLPVLTQETIYHVRTEMRQSLIIYLSCTGQSINLHLDKQCISVTFDDQGVNMYVSECGIMRSNLSLDPLNKLWRKVLSEPG